MIPYNFLNKKQPISIPEFGHQRLSKKQNYSEKWKLSLLRKTTTTLISPKLYRTRRCRLFPYHHQQHHLRHRIENGPGCKRSAYCRHVERHFSRKIDIAKYEAIYAGAQKNLAPAGVTLIIVKEDALGKADRVIPTMLDYRTHVSKGSMFNTPPCLPIYSALQTLKWYKSLGGIEAMEKPTKKKRPNSTMLSTPAAYSSERQNRKTVQS